MRKLIATLALVCVLTAPARAQDAPKITPVYTLALTGPEIAQIGAALGERKYNDVAELIAKIAQQFGAQVRKPAPTSPPNEPPKEQ